MTAPIYFTLPADRAIVCRPRRGPPARAGDRRRVPRLRPQGRGRGRGRRGEAARVGRHSALAVFAVGRRRHGRDDESNGPTGRKTFGLVPTKTLIVGCIILPVPSSA